METEDWIIIGSLILVTIVWFVLFIIYVVRRKSSSSTKQPTQSPTPIQTQSRSQIQFSPSPVPSRQQKMNFSSVKTIDGNGTNFFYMNEGYLSFRQLRDMNQWGIDKPLSYTHAKINNLVFKFNNSTSSDSSGFIVDDFGNKRQTQPPSEFSNKIDFGFFM